MFGDTKLEKAVNGVSFAIILPFFLLLAVAIPLISSGLYIKTNHELEIPRSKLNVKFGYHLTPHLKHFNIPKDEAEKALRGLHGDRDHFLNSVNIDLKLNYNDNHEFESVSASMTHSSLPKQKDLSEFYALFEFSLRKYLSKY